MGFLNRPAIKREARGFIGYESKWWQMILATLAIYALSNSVNVIYRIKDFTSAYSIMYYNDIYYGDSSSTVINFGSGISSLLLIPFTIAMAGYYLNHIRGFAPEWRSLYKEGIDNYGKYFVVGIVKGFTVFLWSLLFIVPGVVKNYAYSLVEYIIHDNPNLTADEAKKMSNIMTQGYKGDLFVRDLSFLPWYLLMGVTVGIAGIYVLPYVNVTNAMYYENLKKNAIDSGLIAPEAFGINVNGGYNSAAGNANPQPPYNGYNNGYNTQPYNYNGQSPIGQQYNNNGYAPQPPFNSQPQQPTQPQRENEYEPQTYTSAQQPEPEETANEDVSENVEVEEEPVNEPENPESESEPVPPAETDNSSENFDEE